MKRLLFSLVLFLSIAQTLKAQHPDPLYLKDAYRKGFNVPGKDTAYYQRLFFKALPSKFKTFDKYYGWDDRNHIGRPLTDIQPMYFERIFSSTAYSRADIAKKIVSISINGVYGVQAIGAFQRVAIQFAANHTADFLRALQVHSTEQIVSVWKFYFDNPNTYVRKKTYDELRKVVARHNKGMETLLIEGYKKAGVKLAKHH